MMEIDSTQSSSMAAALQRPPAPEPQRAESAEPPAEMRAEAETVEEPAYTNRAGVQRTQEAENPLGSKLDVTA